MRVSIITYYEGILLLSAVVALSKDFGLGVYYLVFFLINVIALRLISKSNSMLIPLFIILLFIYLAYFFRGFFLYDNWDYYLYAFKTPTYGNDALLLGLKQATVGTLYIVGGYMAVVFAGRFYWHDLSSVRIPGMLVKNYILIILFLLALIALWFFLIVGLGIGVKGDPSGSGLAFVYRLIPRQLPFALVVLYLTKYLQFLSYPQRAMVVILGLMTMMAVLLTGSKAFIISFAICYMIYLLLEVARVKVINLVLLSLAGVAVFVYSFAISTAVRYSGLVEGNYIDFMLRTWDIITTIDYTVILSEVTARFNGLDGQMVYEIMSARSDSSLELASKSFSTKTMFLNTVDGVIPGVNFTNTLTCGKAVSYYIQKVPFGEAHAGAVGIFASFRLMSSNYIMYILSLGMFGAVAALIFGFIKKIRSYDLFYLVFFYTVYTLLGVVISGNLDSILSKFIIALTIIFVYFFFLKYTGQLVKEQ